VAYNRVVANAVAAMALLNQLHSIDQRKECFPQTASPELGLLLWAGLTNRPRGTGTQAELQADATGTNGETIGTGSTGPRWKSASGIQYSTKTGGTISGGTASITVLANQSGTEGTLQVGDKITLTSTIPGIDTTATITAINTAGAPEESVESWRAAIIQIAAFPPQIGTAAWFFNEAVAVSGITRAYPYVSQLFPGRVEIFCVADDNVDGQPTAPQLAEVEAITATAQKNIMWATDLLPNAQKRLEAFASPIDTYDVVITEGVPALSASLKLSIEASINSYGLTRNPFILGLSLLDQGAVEEVAITTVAQNTVDAETGETGRFTDIGLTKQGDAPADIYILDPGNRAKFNISYT
ncbi:MAG: baseplate J/gp47 family protein, partial [Gammaproteobacteria bacterium]|nr:baseplate J/gp47 family protein [Gammaproteobacteria bacterium]